MVSQAVLPISDERTAAALAPLGTVFRGEAGEFALLAGPHWISVSNPPERRFALVLTLTWPRRVSLDHQAKVRLVLDDMNRESTGERAYLAVGDDGAIRVALQRATWVNPGISDEQLADSAAHSVARLRGMAERLDAEFPDSWGAP